MTLHIDQQIAKLQNEKAAYESLFAGLPVGFPQPWVSCWHGTKRCDFSMTYKVQTLSEAMTLFKAIKSLIGVMSLTLVNDGFLSFQTMAHEPSRNKATRTPVLPLTVSVSQHEMSINFWSATEKHLLSFSIKVADFKSCAFITYYQYRAHTKVERVTLHAPAFKDYKPIKWWSPKDSPNSFTLYWDSVSDVDDIFAEAG